jgi:hypothetical protein
MLKFLYPERSLEWHFKAALKIKKGIVDTSCIHPWTIMTKNKIYLEWYDHIKRHIENWTLNTNLYKGKIKTSDLDYIK